MDKVKITVKSIKGECQAGHCPGQEYILDNFKLSGNLCPDAFNSLWPYIQVLRFGGKYPWGDEDGVSIACPDPDNLAVFDIRRIKEK
jgi:uncharacterized repeat protein (TIGR04076 family)